ncbi:MAG: single-stranded DNA-binding protein, partial [Bacilli bacterium]|nr:single-stranded DNA-binding protein [Bacilli bacterium]
DFVNCTLWGGIAENTANYCKKGDVVGVKGRVQTRLVENENKLEIVAEKLTFLTKAKEKEMEKDEEER